MTLITKVPLQMPFLRACTCASILCLCNCPSELLGSRHGSWGSLHSSEEKAAPSLWKSSSGSSGFPGHCPGGVCAPSMASGDLPCCCDMSDPVTSQGSPALPNFHIHKYLWNFFLPVMVALVKAGGSVDEFLWELGFSWDGCEDDDFFFIWWGCANKTKMTLKRYV